MINSEIMNVAEQSDAELVAACRAGNHEAYRLIVERYQTLICSLAYCATGSVSRSEDLAQETFVAAWKDLAQLREPAKLRSWLCTMVRFRIGHQFRRQGREPVHLAEPMEAMEGAVSPVVPPSAQAITNEETALLWRSLERIPELYREPLVLFYREQQSIGTVAVQLDLTEDAVKQRLARGRKLLQEEVLMVVEGVLTRTNPGQAFTVAVLAALPLTLASSAKAASLATAAAKGGAMATGATFASVLGVLLGPALGVVCGYLGLRTSLKQMHTPRERAFTLRYGWTIGAAVVIFSVALGLFGLLPGSVWRGHPVWLIALGLAITLGYGLFVFVSAWRYGRGFARMREEERRLHPELFPTEPLPLVWEYRSRATFLGLPLVHCRGGKAPGQKKMQPAVGWIAFGEVAYGVLYASGAVAVGGISMGGMSVGIFSFGGFSLGLIAFGGIAAGGIALGGAAIGLVASGGIALGWHAALGGMAAAHELALGGLALATHANDPVARDFYLRHGWLDITQPGARDWFWGLCFAPVVFQSLMWQWWRRKMGALKKLKS